RGDGPEERREADVRDRTEPERRRGRRERLLGDLVTGTDERRVAGVRERRAQRDVADRARWVAGVVAELPAVDGGGGRAAQRGVGGEPGPQERERGRDLERRARRVLPDRRG